MFTFIESAAFSRVRSLYLDDDDYAELQLFLLRNPEAGKTVPGSGGVRKLRWSRRGSGKRGGLRVIYSVRYQPSEFWMLAVYAKTTLKNMPAHILRELKKEFDEE